MTEVSEDILNNLPGMDVVEEINPEAMSTDKTLPPPDGDHQLRISIVVDGVKDEKKRFNPGNQFPANCVQFFTLPERNGRPASTQFIITVQEEILGVTGEPAPGGRRRCWPSTMVRGEGANRTSDIDTLLRAVTGQAGVGMTNIQKIKALYDVLVVTPAVVKAKTEWVGEVQVEDPKKPGETKRVVAKKDGKYLAGMGNFPVNEAGFPVAVDEDDSGNEVYLGWRVKAYYPKGA